MAKIELLNDDCMNVMQQYPDKHFDLAIVDPPYMEDTKNLDNYLNKMRNHGYELKTLQKVPRSEYFNELFRVSKQQIIWGGNYFVELWNKPCRGFIFWYKQNPVKNFADGEFAWTSFNENATCFDYRYYGNLEGKSSAANKIHPTQKPIALYKWLLDKYANPGDKILDTHLGSGSIAIACHDYGFDLVASELDPDYYKATMKRFKEHTAQKSLFF